MLQHRLVGADMHAVDASGLEAIVSAGSRTDGPQADPPVHTTDVSPAVLSAQRPTSRREKGPCHSPCCMRSKRVPLWAACKLWGLQASHVMNIICSENCLEQVFTGSKQRQASCTERQFCNYTQGSDPQVLPAGIAQLELNDHLNNLRV